MIVQKQILKSKNELQSTIQKIKCSKIILYEDANKKAAETIIKELPAKRYTIVFLET